MDNFQNPVPVEYQSQRVLTTAQLAEFYETSTANIKKNFNNNRQRFIEGKHFFKLEGKDLAAFKDKIHNFYCADENSVAASYIIQKGARILYLWTAAGFFMYAKLLSTDRAWEVLSQIGEIMSSSSYLDKIIAEKIKVPAQKSHLACVYALELSDKIVKIGMTGDMEARQSAIQRSLQLEIIRRHHTPFVPRKEALRIENSCHKTFEARLAHHREYFNITFEEACAELDRHTAEIQTTNLIVGKKVF